MSEPEITEELIVELSDVWANKGPRSLRIIHEKSHGKRKDGKKGKTPTIDFCFRTVWDPESYFGVECKLLKEENNTYKQYVYEGMTKYIDGRYGKKCPAGSMVGYILCGGRVNIINGVKIR